MPPSPTRVTVTVLFASAVPFSSSGGSLVISSVLDEPVSVVMLVNTGAAGAVLSRVKVMAVPANVLPALSVAVARTVYVPLVSDAHVGMVALLVQADAVLPVVAP